MTAPMPERHAYEVMSPAEEADLLSVIGGGDEPDAFVEVARPETDSDVLRRAATLLRDRAAQATPGRWYTVGLPWNHETPFVIAGHPDPHGGKFVAEVEQVFGDLGDDDRDHGPDAEWIALMGPILAEPLATFLEAAAEAMSFWAPYRQHEQGYPLWIAALATARQILGEVTP